MRCEKNLDTPLFNDEYDLILSYSLYFYSLNLALLGHFSMTLIGNGLGDVLLSKPGYQVYNLKFYSVLFKKNAFDG